MSAMEDITIGLGYSTNPRIGNKASVRLARAGHRQTERGDHRRPADSVAKVLDDGQSSERCSSEVKSTGTVESLLARSCVTEAIRR
ncbi:MAG: hypothetical protein ACI9W2_000364 [Gammaproteobacteria bacterium]|jgi:hypothetical protein